MSDARSIMERLAEPFADVSYKAQVVKGNRCLPVAYIDARDVMDRLDDVVGPQNWKDEYTIIDGGSSVMCRLSIRIDGEWVTRCDVGSESEQPDGGDRLKAAFSDALKRTAVKFGLARYLYRLELTWCEYDPARKAIVNPPKLPAWAMPKGARSSPPPTPPATAPKVLPAPASSMDDYIRQHGIGATWALLAGALGKYGIDEARIRRALGTPGGAQCKREHLESMRKAIEAVRHGMPPDAVMSYPKSDVPFAIDAQAKLMRSLIQQLDIDGDAFAAECEKEFRRPLESWTVHDYATANEHLMRRGGAR